MTTTVRAEKFIQADPAQVYFSFTHALGLHEWLCDYATVAPRPGGRMYLWWHGDFYSAGEYIALEENRSVAFTWFGRGDPGPSQVKITLQAKSGGTQIVLEHAIPDWKDWKGSPDAFRQEWSVSLDNLASVLETGLDRRVFDRPMLGISISDFNAAVAKAMGVPVTEGQRLDGALENMGAYRAGLRKDDVLVEMAGKPITNDYSSLVLALQGKKGGDRVEVAYYRGPKKITATMELTRRPVPEVPWDAAGFARLARQKYDANLAELEAFLAGVSEAEADFHPAPGEWSVKEILAHLVQNERVWLNNLDDLIGGYERLSDDWGGNINAHMKAIALAYKTTRGLMDELRRLSDELVAFISELPPEFVARKSSYYQGANTILEGNIPHTLAHLDQMKSVVSAARSR